MKRFWILQCILVLSLMSSSAAAQESKVALPLIARAEVALYPPTARVSNVEGQVHLKVITNGHRVIRATAEGNGHPLLVRAAQENIRCWGFTVHEPTAFTVTYRDRLVDNIDPKQNNPTVVLRLPTDVAVDALRWPGTVDLAPTIK
jgi:hypothetical protein